MQEGEVWGRSEQLKLRCARAEQPGRRLAAHVPDSGQGRIKPEEWSIQFDPFNQQFNWTRQMGHSGRLWVGS